MKLFRFVVTVKHFVRYDEDGNILTDGIRYDYDDEFIFTYDLKTLRIQGTAWSKEVEPDDFADAIKTYFAGTNYHIANVEQLLE